MKKGKILHLINVDPYSSTSKYLQIVNAVLKEIEKGTIQAGDNMPSINELSIELDIARDTVERGYKHLRQLGVINAVPAGAILSKARNSGDPSVFFSCSTS